MSDHKHSVSKQDHTSGLFGVIVGLALIGAIFFWAMNQYPGVEKTFSLTKTDVVMIFVTAFLFVGLWRVLDRVLFAPYLKLVQARESATVGAEEQAVQAEHKKAELTAQYDSKIRTARIEAMERKLTLLNSAKAEASKIIEKAETEGQESIRKIRWELATNLENLRKQALQEAQSLADNLVERLRGPLL